MTDVCRVSRPHCLGFLCASADPLTGTAGDLYCTKELLYSSELVYG